MNHRHSQTEQQNTANASIAIPKTNIGFILLQKLGWKEGTGIGANEQGPVEPLIAEQRSGTTGLGYQPTPKRKASSQQSNNNNKIKDIIHQEQQDEDQETKIARVKQVMQAEADDKAGKEIAKYIYSAFKDNSDGGGGGGGRASNPLLHKKSRLTATNPLL